MAERNPEEHTTSHTSGLLAGHNSSVRIMLPRESTKAITISPEGESSASSISQTLSHGTKAKTEKAEWVVLDEPGVYITLSSTSGGGTELKRVRFSPKYFTEEEAEKWWAENSAQVCEGCKVQCADYSP